jgi:hypothetical protein
VLMLRQELRRSSRTWRSSSKFGSASRRQSRPTVVPPFHFVKVGCVLLCSHLLHDFKAFSYL